MIEWHKSPARRCATGTELTREYGERARQRLHGMWSWCGCRVGVRRIAIMKRANVRVLGPQTRAQPQADAYYKCGATHSIDPIS